MSYRLVIANVVEVPVRFTVSDGGKPRAFNCTLLAKRIPTEDLRVAMTDDDRTVAEFLCEQVTGWRGQTLVQDEDGQPAEFSLDALAAMFTVPGLAGVTFSSYLDVCSAKGKKGN
jgi:hypothetical protein